jgi:hypothetical protein
MIMGRSPPNLTLGKKVSTREPDGEGGADLTMADQVADDVPEDVNDSDNSIAEIEAPSQLEPSSTIVPIEEDNRRRSTFSSSLEETNSRGDNCGAKDNEVEMQGGLATPESSEANASQTSSPQKVRSMQAHEGPELSLETVEASMDAIEIATAVISPGEDSLTKETEHNDGPSRDVDVPDVPPPNSTSAEITGSPVKEEQLAATESSSSPSTAPVLAQTSPVVEDSTMDSGETQHQSLEGEPSVSIPLENSVGPAVDEHERGDVEMSEFTLELEDLPGTESSEGLEVETAGGSTEEDLTEASLQLEIERDMSLAEAHPKPTIIGTDEPQDPEHHTVVDATASDAAATISQNVESPDQSGEESPQSNFEFVTEVPVPTSSHHPLDDIADGLTLTPSISTPGQHEEQETASPTRPPTDTTPDETTTTMSLDDDTAILKDFLNRAAASKANKVATIARRSSLQNRRDSDAVRQALASPRKILEDKDPNSPAKYDNDATLDLSQTLTLNMDSQLPLSPTPVQADADAEAPGEEGKPAKSSRRSTRTRKSRLPAPPAVAAPQAGIPKNISVRRADGGEPIVLKRTEAQELGLLTRANTRKNKQGAPCVAIRLLKLGMESDDTTTSATGPTKSRKKNVHWDETLAHYQDDPKAVANALAEAESLATPDELSVTISTPSVKKKTSSKDKKSGESSRVRRVRGLGAANGTPGKGLLAPASLLPEGVVDEKDAPAEKPQRLTKTSTSKLKKLAVSSSTSSDSASPRPTPAQTAAQPVGIEQIKGRSSTTGTTTKERRSRLATPRKVKLPLPASSVPVDGKENQQQTRSIGGATPKKRLKLPEVVVPPVAESGLPRRRPGRKV